MPHSGATPHTGLVNGSSCNEFVVVILQPEDCNALVKAVEIWDRVVAVSVDERSVVVVA